MALTSLTDLRQKELTAAALSVFTTEGASGMTLERVAKEAGASKGIVLHYFGTKDVLQARVIREALRIMGREYRRAYAPTTSVEDRIAAHLSFSVNPELFTPAYARVWLSAVSVAATDQTYGRLRRTVLHRSRSNLVAWLRPLVGSIEARPVAESLMAMTDGLWLRRALEPGSITPEGARALLLTHLDESLAFVAPR